MRKIIIFIVLLIGFISFSNAQISDSYLLNPNDLTIQQIGEYQQINTIEDSYTDEVGNPQLPVKIVSYVLPYESTVTSLDINVTQQQLDGNYYIYPAQPLQPLDGSDPPPFSEPNIIVYNSSDPYPNKTVEVISDGYAHGYHVVTLAIYPVEYNPVNQEIYLQNISFTINYSSSFDNNLSIPFEKQSYKRAELGKQFVQSIVKNVSDVENSKNNNVQIIYNSYNQDAGNSTDSNSTSAIDVLIPDYIIITNNELKPTFQTLADWKTKKGVPAIIKTIEEIAPEYQGSDLQEKIRNYLKEAYTKYGASLFVLLGGDVNIVPDRLFDTTSYATDLYYATVGGTWNANKNNKFGEENDDTDYNYAFFLGRASVENVAESQTFVNKVVNYEKCSNLEENTYVNNFLCIAGFLSTNKCGVFYEGFYDEHIETANNHMPSNINKWFLFDNYDCQFNIIDPYSTPYAYHNFTDPHCDLTAYLDESFETNINPATDLPDGWQKSDNNWERVPPPSSIGVHHGDMVMKFKASSIGNGNYSYLISPVINIPNNQTIKISVYHDNIDSTGDKLVIEYELNGEWVVPVWGIIQRYRANTKYLGWREHIYYNLPQGITKIRIKGVSAGGSDIYIDYVSISSFVIRPGGICIPGNQSLNKTNAKSCLNNGGESGLGNFHIVHHIQHSAIKSMGISRIENKSFINADFDSANLINTNFQQIMFSNGCEPASFNYDCIAEHYINNPNGGGVAFIGNSDAGYYGEHVQFKRFCQALYNSNTTNCIATTFQQAPDPSDNDERRRLTLLGDPEMPIWTATPQTSPVQNISINNPDTNGNVTISVVLKNTFSAGKTATVCIQKGNECYLVETITSTGSTSPHTFIITPHTTGIVNVTVTAQNYIPYEHTGNVTVNRNIYITNLDFDDDDADNSIGNSDGQLDAGETIELTIQLKNSATTSATNVSTILTCNSQYITILTNTSNFGTISAGSTKSSPAKYVFSIAPDAPEIFLNELDQIKFMLQITATISGTTYTYHDNFNIEIFNPDLELRNKIILTGKIAPGATVSINIELFNKGKATATGVTAILTSNSQYITNCSASPRNYPEIKKHETEKNTTVYKFSISPSYISGQALNFNLQVINEYGKLWNYNFDLTKEPANISSIDFTGDSTSIKLTWAPLTPLSYIKGYNVYRCYVNPIDDSEVGDYEKINTFVFPAAFYEDSGLDVLTKYYYRVSAVDTSGNDGPLSDPLLAWTSYSIMDGFPVSMYSGGRIQSSINAIDVNTDNEKEIFASIEIAGINNGFLIGLKPDGSELFDIDGNPTTYSGLAEIGNKIQCTPAIGELQPFGGYKIVSMTRKFHSPNNIFCHSAIPIQDNPTNIEEWKHNSPLNNPCYRSPIIADLDADGLMENIFYSEYGGIAVYNSDGTIKYNIPEVGDTWEVGGTYGALAVADINNDGNKEIIGCYKNAQTSGIYIWKYDGTDYGDQPFYNLSGYSFENSVIVCDLDNDGYNDVLTVVFNTTSNSDRVVAINRNGIPLNGWNDTQTISHPQGLLSKEIAVGDLDGDNYLEVVVFGSNQVKIWDHNGNLINTIAIENLYPEKITPILADVDNDLELEIIVASGKLIEAYKMSGRKVLGFPLNVDEDIPGSPCVADIDNNGKNEIITGSGNKVYVWETKGNSIFIGWGSERANPQNTGEYFKATCAGITISDTTIWTTAHKFCGDVIVESGATLAIHNSVLFMAPDCKIIVKPGAKLIIDGGKLSNACRNEFWRGVEVYGNKSMVQHPDCQGQVIMRNGACIENAVVAIKAGDIMTSNFDGGGIVNINNSIFRNNLYSLIMEDYRYIHNGEVCSNTSYIIDTHFYIDDYMFKNPYTFVSHIRLCEVEGVRFAGCNFEYLKSGAHAGRAIYSLSAGFKVLEVCRLSPNQGCECDGILTRSTFQGFNCAIEYGEHSSTAANIVIDNCEFRNNLRGIKASAINNMQITRSTFNFTTPLSGNSWSGIHLSNCSGYLIEENQFDIFTDGKSNYITTGMYINNSGTDENIIYRNYFQNLTYGIYVSGINGTTVDNNIAKIKGLQFNCNSFENNKYDIYIDNTGIVRSSQGDKTKGADNIFSNTTDCNIYCGNLLTSIQYYHFDNNMLEPVSISSNITVFLSKNENKCESTLCDSIYIIIDDPIKQYKSINIDYNNTQNTFFEKGYDKVLKEYFSTGYFEDEILLEEALFIYNKISGFSIEMSNLSNNNISFVKNDSIVELLDLNPWYSIVQEPLQKYLLAETHILEKEYGKAKDIIKDIPKTFDLSEIELDENQNYFSYYNFRESIRKQGKSLAQLDEKEIITLEKIALEVDGLASAMAKNILCFFYDICIETEMPMEKSIPIIENQQLKVNNVDNNVNKIHVYPNPGKDYITVVSEIESYNFELFNINGSKQISIRLQKGSNTINTSAIKQGIYIYKVIVEDEIISGKWVKN